MLQSAHYRISLTPLKNQNIANKWSPTDGYKEIKMVMKKVAKYISSYFSCNEPIKIEIRWANTSQVESSLKSLITSWTKIEQINYLTTSFFSNRSWASHELATSSFCQSRSQDDNSNINHSMTWSWFPFQLNTIKCGNSKLIKLPQLEYRLILSEKLCIYNSQLNAINAVSLFSNFQHLKKYNRIECDFGWSNWWWIVCM